MPKRSGVQQLWSEAFPIATGSFLEVVSNPCLHTIRAFGRGTTLLGWQQLIMVKVIKHLLYQLGWSSKLWSNHYVEPPSWMILLTVQKSRDHELRLVVEIPLLTGFLTSKRWCRSSEPSTVWRTWILSASDNRWFFLATAHIPQPLRPHVLFTAHSSSCYALRECESSSVWVNLSSDLLIPKRWRSLWPLKGSLKEHQQHWNSLNWFSNLDTTPTK